MLPVVLSKNVAPRFSFTLFLRAPSDFGGYADRIGVETRHDANPGVF